VPETDRTPPRPVVRVAGARATFDRGAPPVLVSQAEPIKVTAVGRDRDGGMGRARIAIRARLTCRDAGGRVTTQSFVRYVRPPQVVHIRSAPGTSDTLRWAAVQAAQQAWRPNNPWRL
jgi:hypothetical protein